MSNEPINHEILTDLIQSLQALNIFISDQKNNGLTDEDILATKRFQQLGQIAQAAEMAWCGYPAKEIKEYINLGNEVIDAPDINYGLTT